MIYTNSIIKEGSEIAKEYMLLLEAYIHIRNTIYNKQHSNNDGMLDIIKEVNTNLFNIDLD